MKRLLVALFLALGVGIALPGAALADPELPEPPHPSDLPRPPDPPGPAPRPPAPGELPHVDDDHPWWDPLGLFDDDDDKHHDNHDDHPWWDPLGLFADDDEHRGRGHDKHEGKKQKHREKHDD